MSVKKASEPMQPSLRLLNRKEAADLLRVSERTIWNMTRNKRIPYVRVGVALRFPMDKLESWLKSKTQEATT